MNPISAAELASIQSDVAAAACDKTCAIQRKTRTPDGMGQATETYATIATVKAGMAQPSQQLLQNYDYLIAALSAWLVKFPVGTTTQPQDRLLIDGQTLEVHVVLEPRSYQALLTVLAAEVK